MANIDLSQILGDTQTPSAGDMPQQPMVPQQFPIDNPILKAAQGLGGALQGNPNVQGGPPVSIQDMLPSMPKNKLQALLMLAGPAMGLMAKGAGNLSKTAPKTTSAIEDAIRWVMSQEGLSKGSQETPEIQKFLGHDLESRITAAYNQIDDGSKNTVTFYKLKQLLPDISKQDFDQAVLRMTSGQKSPFLASVHDSAPRIAAMGGDVSDFVHDPHFDPTKDVGGSYLNQATAPKGRYYVSMYKR